MLIGFAATYNLAPERIDVAHRALDRALRHFPWLTRRVLTIGAGEVHLWGHGPLDDAVHVMEDGSYLIRIGWPVGDATWSDAARALADEHDPARFVLPWEGRLILLRISPDGSSWSAWNDWNGSIPLFHARAGAGRIASTLEPVVVAASGFTSDDFYFPALVSLLLNGHFVGDWTLFEGMKVLPPDSLGVWSGDRFDCTRLWTVTPGDERWERGWDELAAEMYDVMRRGIAETLRGAPSWTLPLSGGVDSRLIAAVGVAEGIEMTAYTYGPEAWKETLYARQVAKALGIPWRRIDLGVDYLASYSPMWGDWFGSAMHFHGMYQMPFLEAIRDVSAPIVTGFIGDPLGGAQTAGMVPGERSMLRRLTDKWYMWSLDELRSIMRRPIDEAIDAIEAELLREYDSVPGAHFQKIWMTFEWSHVFGFSYYQPMMYDYWKGVGTPFVDRRMARFTLSLPRLALEGRRLQSEMFRRHLPSVATLPVSFLGMPFKLSRSYLMRRGMAEALPRPFRRGPLREFDPLRNTLDQDAIRAGGKAALWPIHDVWERLDQWIDTTAVAAAHRQAEGGDLQAVNRLEAVQALAFRLLEER